MKPSNNMIILGGLLTIIGGAFVVFRGLQGVIPTAPCLVAIFGLGMMHVFTDKWWLKAALKFTILMSFMALLISFYL